MNIILQTKRLRLREFVADDSQWLFEMDSDPEVMWYITDGVPNAFEKVRDEMLPRWMGAYRKYEGFGCWAAMVIETAEPIGWFHFKPAEIAVHATGAEVELGYRFKRSAWGRGFATEGSRAILDRGFREFDVQRVIAVTLLKNKASARVMDKLGMRFVEEFIEELFHGKDKRAVRYAIDRSEWLGCNS